MAILAFIPARGGSKGIVKKNLVSLLGRPLIQYTLDFVKQLDSLVIPFVSTDDEEISSFCEAQGFDMSYRRSMELSRDNSLVIDAIFDALQWCGKNSIAEIDAVLLLQPTNPLRYVDEVQEAVKKFQNDNLDSMISVTPMKEHPYECVEIGDKYWSYLRNPESVAVGRQQYSENFFFIDGSFYLAKTSFLKEQKSFIQEKRTEFFILQRNWPIDIDEMEDLVVAEALMS